jgi:type IV secretion system protein VirD4
VNASEVLPRSWPTGRKLAALSILFAFALLSCAVSYVSAALFLLLSKADPRQATLTSVFDYWHWYSADPMLRKKLIASISASGVGLLIVLPAAAAAARRGRALHGDARFASLAEVRNAGLLGGSWQPRGPSILIGRYRGKFLALPGQLSVMLSAPTRSGKGVGVVVPNLLNWPDSVVVLDIKGENYAITAGYRARCGQSVYAFSPFDETARSHRWNPLTAVRTDRLHRVGDLLAVGQVLFPSEGTSTSSEAFFNDQARNLFLGLGLLLLETPELPRTIGEMLRQSSGKGRALKDHLVSAIAARSEQRRPYSEECADALQRLLSTSESTLSSIVSTFNAPLTIFADAVVDAATSADDFSLADVRRRRMSVYVCIPPNRLASARPLLNLFFSQLVNLNTQRLPTNDRKRPLQCLLVHDEFTSMGRVGVISSAAAFLAGYNLRLLTVVQAMSQLDSVYGDKDARTFATNHGLQILFAPREQRDAEEYSAMLGYFTARATSRGRSRSFSTHGHTTVSRNESEQRRSLLLPQEFKELGSERLVAIAENCKPILAEKIRYHKERAFTARLRPAPPVPALDMDLHFAKAQQRCRFAPEELPDGEAINVEALALDLREVPELGPAATPVDVNEFLGGFFRQTRVDAPSGGEIEPLCQDNAGEPEITAHEPASELH